MFVVIMTGKGVDEGITEVFGPFDKESDALKLAMLMATYYQDRRHFIVTDVTDPSVLPLEIRMPVA